MAQTVYFFIASFNKDLPWAGCDPDWFDGGPHPCENGTVRPEFNVTNAALYYE